MTTPCSPTPLLATAEQVFHILGNPIRYFAKRRGTTGGFCTTPGALVRVMENLRDWNLYVHLNPSKPRSVKASEDDVLEVRWVLLDFDPLPGHAGNFLSLPGWTRDLPFLAVATGRGFQLWVPVRPHIPDHRWSHSVRLWMRTLSAPTGYILDPATSDSCRVARLPGSINLKSGRVARILHDCLDGRLDPEVILSHYQAPPPSAGVLPAALEKVLPLIPAACADYLTQGVVYPHRDRLMYATAIELAKGGIPLDTALEWLQYGNLLSKPRPLPQRELIRQTKNAYRKAQRATNHVGT